LKWEAHSEKAGQDRQLQLRTVRPSPPSLLLGQGASLGWDHWMADSEARPYEVSFDPLTPSPCVSQSSTEITVLYFIVASCELIHSLLVN
jgi:hypothetical protein